MQRNPISPASGIIVSVPFNAGRGLMQIVWRKTRDPYDRFSTLQCGSWIDAARGKSHVSDRRSFSTLQCGSWIDALTAYDELVCDICVSVPFNAGRGLMPQALAIALAGLAGFSTLQCGSWIDAN